jgi:hypothetical protein
MLLECFPSLEIPLALFAIIGHSAVGEVLRLVASCPLLVHILINLYLGILYYYPPSSNLKQMVNAPKIRDLTKECP